MRITLIAAAATLLLCQVASAQTAIPGSSSSPAANPSEGPSVPERNQNQQPIRAQIQKNLQSAGFTDIHIMASSFIVRAKDRDGNPVMMVINPDSVTAVTEMGGASSPNQGSTMGVPNKGSTKGSATPNGSSSPTGR
jgi:hypothetical protein